MSVTNPAIGIPTDEQKKQIEGWINNLPKCGCGRVGRYETQSGLACNKYMRCDNTEFLAEQNQQLQAKVAELEEENARWKNSFERTAENTKSLLEQLAAEQLNNKLLRDALEFFFPDWKTYDHLSWKYKAKEALSTPISTEALDAYVKQKIKEYN